MSEWSLRLTIATSITSHLSCYKYFVGDFRQKCPSNFDRCNDWRYYCTNAIVYTLANMARGFHLGIANGKESYHIITTRRGNPHYAYSGPYP